MCFYCKARNPFGLFKKIFRAAMWMSYIHGRVDKQKAKTAKRRAAAAARAQAQEEKVDS